MFDQVLKKEMMFDQILKKQVRVLHDYIAAENGVLSLKREARAVSSACVGGGRRPLLSEGGLCRHGREELS